MTTNDTTAPAQAALPSLTQPPPLRTNLLWSLYGVWYRHARVYRRHMLANAAPPVLEPLFFFSAVALGLARYMRDVDFDGLPYATFVASGLMVSSAMFTSVFESTFGTFIRLVYQKTYDAMLGTHLRISEMFTGEMLFCATKGAAFATIVMLVTTVFGVHLTPWCALIPLVGGLTGYLFAAIGLCVTTHVKTINNFSFFTSGVISPMFFFSGTFFPVRGHHWAIDLVSHMVPLTHCIELARALFRGQVTTATGLHALLLAAMIILFHSLAIRGMTKRVLG